MEHWQRRRSLGQATSTSEDDPTASTSHHGSDDKTMHPGDHRPLDELGTQGAAGDRRRLPGERPVVARTGGRISISSASARGDRARATVLQPSAPSSLNGALGFWNSLARSMSTGRRLASFSAVGCTRPPTCSTSCRSPSSHAPSNTYRTCWIVGRDQALTRRRPSTSSWRPMANPKVDILAVVSCLAKDEATCYSPSTTSRIEHWKHIRTTYPIESTFATVRLRTTKTKGCLSRMTALTMVFKLCQSASKKWRFAA